MKKLTSIILICLLASSVTLTGCLSTKTKNTSDSSASSGSAEVTTVAATDAATTAAEAENKEVVLYDENGIKLTYTGYKEDIFPTLNYQLENNSDKSYMVRSEDVSINDCMISTSILETIAPGKKSAVKMTMFESDLEDNGIEKIEKVEFKLHCTNSDDYLDSFDSDVITINNP